MMNYYYLIAAFPPLSLDVRPAISFRDVRDMLEMNLTSRDLKELEQLLRPIDLYNIRALWLGEPLDDRGNFKAKDLEEELFVKQDLPEYLTDYLDRYDSTEDCIKYFSSLYASLYRESEEKLKGFLAQYYRFERELRLMLVALRAKRKNRDIVRELQFENPNDPTVALILAQKDTGDFVPPREYEDVKTIFLNNAEDPKKLNEVLLQYKFNQIEEMEEPQDFGMDRVLPYIARLLIVETLFDQDKELGMEQLSQYE